MIRFTSLVVMTLGLAACASLEIGVPQDTEAPTTTTTSTTLPEPTTTSTTIPPARFEGIVVSGSGVPVGGALVRLADLSAVADGEGRFAIESRFGGEVSISKPGWTETVVPWDGLDTLVEIELERWRIRGLHISGTAAGSDAAFSDLLALASDTAVNTFVFDTKQEGGKVLYDTGVAEAHEMGAVEPTYDPSVRVAQAHYAGLYTITRIVTFEDWYRARARPEEKLAGPWIDPRSQNAWDYNIALAVEACGLGFDEIQFDYVRWPSGQTARTSGQMDLSQDERVGAIAGFLERARSRLEPMGCAISADVFGIVLATENDQGLGQRPEELSAHLDALSPMVYPSHYALGWLGYADPNDYPYEVTVNAIEDALPRLHPGAVLRPWLQAFWWTNEQIKESILAAEERGVGWMMWNVNSNFDRAALPGVDEVDE